MFLVLITFEETGKMIVFYRQKFTLLAIFDRLLFMLISLCKFFSIINKIIVLSFRNLFY